MNEMSFAGRIATDDPAVVERILRAWAPSGELDTKVRISGEEFAAEAPGFSLFVQNAIGEDEPYYLVSGRATAPPEKVRADLERLLALCTAEGVVGEFEYVEVDEDGNVVGEERYVE